MRVALVQQPLDHRQNNNNYFMNHVEWNDKNEIFIYLQNKTKNSFTIDFIIRVTKTWSKTMSTNGGFKKLLPTN